MMLEFLKYSTFKTNQAIVRSIRLLKGHYFSIAGLCLALFVVSSLSTFLSIYLQYSNSFVRVFMLLFFIVVYFSLQLILLKRAIQIVKRRPDIGLEKYIPTFGQFLHYIMGLALYGLLAGLIYLVTYVMCFGLVWMGVPMEMVQSQIHPLFTGAVILLLIIRTIFYPLFIIEHGFSTAKAYKYSIALTKGNVFRLLMIVLVISSTHLLQVVSEYFEYEIISKILSIINSFIIIPLVSIVISTVYIDMMKNFEVKEDPGFVENII